MKILAIDSSAVSASVAVTDDNKLIGEFFLNTGLTHSRTLMCMVEAALSCSDLKICDIDLFAVTNGPGSFTGVRIGVSSVMGMAEALNKPCIGVSTLHAMAYNMKSYNGYVCSVMDARCNQVYTALFKVNNGTVQRITEDEAISIDELSDRLPELGETVCFIGDGAKLCYDRLEGKISCSLPSENLIYQRAFGAAMAVYENELYKSSHSPDALNVSYLRLSQAERERKAKMEVNNK